MPKHIKQFCFKFLWLTVFLKSEPTMANITGKKPFCYFNHVITVYSQIIGALLPPTGLIHAGL